jgi:hypothetical protein
MYIFRFIKEQRPCFGLDVDGELYNLSGAVPEKFADVSTRLSLSVLIVAVEDALSVARDLSAFKVSKREEQQRAVCTTA